MAFRAEGANPSVTITKIYSQPLLLKSDKHRGVRPQTLIVSLATVVQLVGCLGPSLFSLLTAAVSQ